jgi:hypothetical protein
MQKTNRDLTDADRLGYFTDAQFGQNADLLIRSLSSADEEDSMTCEECETALPDYLLAERDEMSTLIRWRSVVRHLVQCPHCANALRETSELMALGLAEYGVSPLTIPAPNLSFLRYKQDKATQPQADFWYFDKLGQLIIRLGNALLSPPTRLAPAYALRSEKEEGGTGAGGQGPLGRLSLGSPTLDDLQVDVTVLPDKDDPDLCTVVARVETPSRWPDVARREVTLAAGDVVSTEVTDESGEASFRRIPIATLDNATLGVRGAQ